MESGEKEFRQIFEETTTRNVRAAVDHGNETRRIVRDSQAKIDLLEGQLRQTNQSIEDLRNLVVNLEIKAYRGGT